MSEFYDTQIEKTGYDHILPDELRSGGGLSTQRAQDIEGVFFDCIVVGGGIAGVSAAYHAARAAARDANRGAANPFRILLVDQGRVLGGATTISGGQIGVGVGVDHEWVGAALGDDARDDFYRRSLLSVAFLRRAAEKFEFEYGYPVAVADGLLTGVTHKRFYSWAESEAAYLENLLARDAEGDRNRETRVQRLDTGGLSVAPLRGAFSPRFMTASQGLPGRYETGFLNAGEFAVNPAMLRFMLIGLLCDTDFGAGVAPVAIQEHLSVTHVDVEKGVVSWQDGGAVKSAYAGRVITAGVDASRLNEALTHDSVMYHSLIAVAKPPPVPHWRNFSAAVHGTDDTYTYMVPWQDGAGHFVIGNGDWLPSVNLSTADKMAVIQESARDVLGCPLDVESIYSGGKLVYAADGLFEIQAKGRVVSLAGLGGKALSASWMLGRVAAEASGDPEGREARFLGKLTARVAGFDPAALAAARPHYIVPPNLEPHITAKPDNI